MKKMLPSKQIGQEISLLLSNGTNAETNLLTELVRKSIQRLMQEALEQEVTDHPGRGTVSVADRRCLTEAIAMGMTLNELERRRSWWNFKPLN